MNVGSINERIKELDTQAEQLKAALHACLGAIQDCKYWLQTLESENAPSQIKE